MTEIGESAFRGCTGLTSVVIGNSMTEIGDWAFDGCTGLTNIVIGNSVMDYQDNTFKGCTGLTNICVSEGNKILDSRDNCNAIIVTTTNELILGCVSTLIPNSVTKIGEYAFRGCTGLTNIVIPDSVTEIGEHAFSDCTGLTGIVIPNSVTKIGACAFYGCTGLTNFVIPESVTEIGDSAFKDCTGLTSIVIPDSVTKIGRWLSSPIAFDGCTGLKSIKVSEGNKMFDSRENCNAIIETATNKLITGCATTVIPDSVTEIGEYTFQGCTGLTDIIIGNSVKEIGRYAFSDCKGLASILIPASVKYLNYEVFKGCINLKNIKVAKGNPVYDSRNNCNAIIETKENKLVVGFVTTVIPATVVEIAEFAFRDVNIAEIFIHEGIKKIGDFAFELTGINRIRVAEGNTVYDSRGDCNAIIETETNSLVMGCSKTIIPDTVTKINNFAFMGCSDLKEIVIPDSVIEIGVAAFQDSGLKSVVIGKKVKYIEREAFSCKSLETITFRGSAPKMDKTSYGTETAFKYCESVKVINVPVGKSSIYARRLHRGNFSGVLGGEWEGLLVELPVEKKASKRK